MSNPLAQVIRFITDAGIITADNVQDAITQLEAAHTTDTALLLDHHARHQNGGADQLDLTGLTGILTTAQNADHILAHAITGSLVSNAILKYNGTNFVITTDATGTSGGTPAAHVATHQLSGSDVLNVGGLSGTLADPQNAGSINGVVVNSAGITDQFVIKYDAGTSKFILSASPTTPHHATHETTGSDPITSLPTANEKAALDAAVSPGSGNAYVTQSVLDGRVNATQAAAISGAASPSGSNVFITTSALGAIPHTTVNNAVVLPQYYLEPLLYSNQCWIAATLATDIPLAVVSQPSTQVTLTASPGSGWIFNNGASSITSDSLLGRAIGDAILITSGTSLNLGLFRITGIASNVATVTPAVATETQATIGANGYAQNGQATISGAITTTGLSPINTSAPPTTQFWYDFSAVSAGYYSTNPAEYSIGYQLDTHTFIVSITYNHLFYRTTATTGTTPLPSPAVHKQIITTDSSGGIFTITLPVSPTLNDEIIIKDITASAGTNNVTIASTLNIDGVSGATLSVNSQAMRLKLYSMSLGWLSL
jgi:hypothetical protein